MKAFIRRMQLPLAMLLCLLTSAASARASGPITEFPIPTASRNPAQIVTGPDGNLWFTEGVPDGGIGKITPSGIITEFPVATNNNPFPLLGPITAGSDGAVWFRSRYSDGTIPIARITPDGKVTEMTDGFPTEMTLGPDGAIWYTRCSSIGRVSPGGTSSDVKLPLPSSRDSADYCTADGEAVGITSGPDGNIWFAVDGNGAPGDSSRGQIGRITLSRQITLFDAGGYNPSGIAAGPDGNLWFTDRIHGVIGRSTLSGEITAYSVPGGSSLRFITAGPDGNLWFTKESDQIGRITPDGEIAEISLPTGSGPSGIAVGPDHAIWFTESGSNKIGRLELSPCSPNSLCLGGRFQVTAAWEGSGFSGNGAPVSLTANAGYFSFFGSSNVEVFVKILDACAAAGRFNVYVNGLTHLGVTVTVTDTRTGTSKQYINPTGSPFSLIFDGSTFACP